VDVDGDGYHELVRGIPGGDGVLFDHHGAERARLGGTVGLTGKFAARPGEQVLTYHADGTVRVWADLEAADTDVARRIPGSIQSVENKYW
jgi:hypothetical protein